jgi:sugar-specific transcriptional regulator TrmB
MISVSQIKQSLFGPLRELGCTDQEIELYAISLATGPSSINAIAEQMQIARPNIYKLIRSLEEKGLARFSDKKKYARDFIVSSPSVVLGRIRAKRKDVDDNLKSLSISLPDLLALYRQGDAPTKIQIIQTKEQFVSMFWSTLDEAKETIRVCGSAGDFIGFISWDEERKWIKERVKRNLKMQSLLLPDADAKVIQGTDAKDLRETRILSKAAPFSTLFQVFGHKVIFWQPKAPLAVVIEDEFIVEMMKSLFDELWEASA